MDDTHRYALNVAAWLTNSLTLDARTEARVSATA